MVGFLVLAGLNALTGQFLTAFAILGLAGGLLLLTFPDVATMLVVFVLYSNLAVIGVRFHGLPSIAALLLPALLAIPLFDYFVIQRKKLVVTSSLPWLALFIAVLMISAALSRDISASFGNVTSYITEGFIIVVLITNAIRSSEQMRRVIWALLAAAILLGGVPLYQQLTETYDNNYFGLAQSSDATFATGQEALQGEVRQTRLAGAIGEINRFAQVMLMLVPLGIMRFFSERSPLLKVLAFAAATLAGIGMVLAFSRGAAVAFGVMILVMVLFRIIKPLQLAAFLLTSVILLAAMPQYTNRLVSIQELRALFDNDAPSADGAIRGRATVMMAAALAYADHPVFGVGPGLFNTYSREYSLGVELRTIYENREAHNLYLGLAAETGTLGLLLFLGALAVTFRDLFMIRKKGRGIRPDLENIATSFILVLVAYLSTGLFLHFSYMRFFWLMFGLACAAAHIGKKELAQTLAEREGRQAPEPGTLTETHSGPLATAEKGAAP